MFSRNYVPQRDLRVGLFILVSVLGVASCERKPDSNPKRPTSEQAPTSASDAPKTPKAPGSETSGKAYAGATAAAGGAAGGVTLPPLSGNIPVVIPPHNTNLSPTDSRPFFDMFSWESFIALNWPAAAGLPGVPNQPGNPTVFQSAPNGTPVVWASYKTIDDLFSTGPDRPKPWSEGPTYPPNAGAKPGGVVLTRVTKGSTAEELSDPQEAFSFPLVDQHSAYARYEVRYNRPFYDFVRGSDAQQATWLYLSKNLAALESTPKGVVMPVANPTTGQAGAMMVKGAWRPMTADDVKGNRYYMIEAQVEDIPTKSPDPKTKSYTTMKMGLVGLHIAQKLPNFPEWIWSSFEQVDNVPRGDGSKSGAPLSFNNGQPQPVTTGGWYGRPPSQVPVANPTPVQVTRLNPIPTTPAGQSTVDVNRAYQQALKGTVWENYELVITQWPSDPGTFATMEAGGVYPGSAGGAFPATGCVNTTMETYFQAPNDAVGAGGNSCMSCHYRAGLSDFSWGLMRRAH